jgi:tRNA-uridine 2-sulfurtransferase
MTKVIVAMSGGVDSSVAAALLKEQGYDVTGIMLRLWSEPGCEADNRCCSPDSMALARRVAARLDIPFYVIDAQELFRQNVVQYFLDGYAAGQTPNPCLICNRLIRWEFLLERAMELGASAMATGHYVRLRTDGQGKIQLLRAIDHAKDQSYVLHLLTQDKLAHALFPVGELPKSEVRLIAQRFNLPTATRSDSQDLCFLAGGDYRDFLRRNAPEMITPGAILGRDGVVLGEHSGLAFYTIGQRKGLGLASSIPLYVLAKDVQANTLIVGPVDQLGMDTCEVSAINWIAGEASASPRQVTVKTRYTARETPAEMTLFDQGSRASLSFDAPQRDITPGQAAVFYDGEIVLGGGMISK